MSDQAWLRNAEKDAASVNVFPARKPFVGSVPDLEQASNCADAHILNQLEVLSGAAAAQPVLEDLFLIDELVPFRGLIALYAAPGAGKSMFALSAALAVARGVPFLDKEVEQGGVVYCALEGRAAFRNRLAAYCKHNSLNASAGLGNFHLAGAPLDLRSSSGDSEKLVRLVEYLRKTKPTVPTRLIVIDTLNQAFCGGDENSSADMGAFIAQLQCIVQKTNAAVMIVHHSGKTARAGMRGHSSLKAAVDTELEISRESGTGMLQVTKQRDGEDRHIFKFKLDSVPLGKSPKGRDVTSAVFVHLGQEVANKAKKPNGKVQTLVFNALREIANEDDSFNGNGESTPRKWAFYTDVLEHAAQMSKRISPDREVRVDNLKRPLRKIIERGLIKEEGERLYLE